MPGQTRFCASTFVFSRVLFAHFSTGGIFFTWRIGWYQTGLLVLSTQPTALQWGIWRRLPIVLCLVDEVRKRNRYRRERDTDRDILRLYSGWIAVDDLVLFLRQFMGSKCNGLVFFFASSRCFNRQYYSNNIGRQIAWKSGLVVYLTSSDILATTSQWPRAAEVAAWLNAYTSNSTNELVVGNKMFWKADYMVHM